MAQRIAIIDMGTNTFHLMVAERGTPMKIIFRDRSAVKLGKGGINEGRITPDAFARAIRTLKDFKDAADKMNAKKILAFATSAVRSAVNGQELVNEIRNETGIEVSVISGNEEAALIYAGVRGALDLGSDKSLIVDVGGGSVEFIIADDKRITWKRSFDVGGQRLLERFHKHDPIAPNEIEDLTQYLKDVLDPLFHQLRIHNPSVLVGVSGTFDTLSEIYCNRNQIKYHAEAPETPLTLESFDTITEELVSKNRAQRLAIPGMIEMRVDMIVVACLLVNLIVDNHSFSSVRVSTWSLKEGAMIEYAT